MVPRTDNPFYQPYFAVRLMVLVAVMALTNWAFLPTQTMLNLVAEGGPVENATVVFYYLAIIGVWLFRPPSVGMPTALALHIVMFDMAARELDLHKRLTGMSLLKLRFWTGSTPASAKLIAALILLPLALSLVYLVRTYGRRWLAALKRRSPVAISATTFFATLVISKLSDRSLGAIKETIGWVGPDWLVALQQSIEEPFEMMLPLLILLTVLQARRNAPAAVSAY